MSTSSSEVAGLTPFSSHSEPTTAPSSPPISKSPLRQLKKQTDLTREQRFARWRPAYHLMARDGWMNDPCAPGYDPKTGLYHVSFQWNPSGPDWADISWGSATSPDMINWTLQDEPSLRPEASYDNRGIFSGCMINGKDGSLTYAYTSVNHLPINHTIPHVKGSESLSLAKSFDGGKTLQRIDSNPILPSEPADLDVTGWRDPFVAKWPRMARYLSVDENDTLFGIVSGGIRYTTATTFLYAIDANDLSRWRYIGPLSNFGLNLRPSKWSGDFGKNWEMTNFTTLRDSEDPSIERDFVIMGTEGCIPERRPSAPDPDTLGPSRPSRGQLWYSGDLQTPRSTNPSLPSPVEMTFNFGGHLDNGCLYAANSFFDPKTQKQIVWGWITEEDICDDLRHDQGWSGCLAMPRELSLQTLHDVVGTSSGSDLNSITSIEKNLDTDDTYTIRTLASEPYAPLVSALRQHPNVKYTYLPRSELGPFNSLHLPGGLTSKSWELDTTFSVARSTQHIGISISHAEDNSRTTTLFYDQPSESFVINRPAFPVLNSSELVNSQPERAPFTLFEMRQTGREELRVRVWRDNSVMEVFVNGRCAISTRIYAAEDTFGVKFFADECVEGIVDVPSQLLRAEVWDGIGI
ncbi:hypothetical protein AC578_5795 [Pseudocercospora eumusae]|uniref:Glycosyl hydrolase family 32 N-terminal domain-containing protein n=1 Tax=Pseudocercospora eumusae TaxID=321146 RepID=A0A139HCD5_9PEZI|nr:hypothetical protein AC578_5795 [Pseudocercospora eumusae]